MLVVHDICLSNCIFVPFVPIYLSGCTHWVVESSSMHGCRLDYIERLQIGFTEFVVSDLAWTVRRCQCVPFRDQSCWADRRFRTFRFICGSALQVLLKLLPQWTKLLQYHLLFLHQLLRNHLGTMNKIFSNNNNSATWVISVLDTESPDSNNSGMMHTANWMDDKVCGATATIAGLASGRTWGGARWTVADGHKMLGSTPKYISIYLSILLRVCLI